MLDRGEDAPAARDPSAERRVRLRIGVGAAVVLVLGAFAVAVVIGLLSPGGATAVVSTSPKTSGSGGAGGTGGSGGAGGSGGSGGAGVPDAAVSSAPAVYVQLVGAVARPGLYRLPVGSRMMDAIAAAGGFAADADHASVNLARPLVDGEQIAVGTPGSPVAGSAPPGSAPPSGGKVNLNTADAAALETLPRIGPAMAQRILDWRTRNGRFRAVEDLLDVTGIGAATFAGLKDLVTV